MSTLREDESDQELDEAEAAELIEALPHDADDLPPIDFSTFVVSLRTSAMLHLESGHDAADGVQAGGASAREPWKTDLAFARQEIDLLGILEEKTRGNLTGEEERLLSQILFDLNPTFSSWGVARGCQQGGWGVPSISSHPGPHCGSTSRTLPRRRQDRWLARHFSCAQCAASLVLS